MNDLGGELSFGGPAITAVEEGTYEIIPGGLTSTNYAISFVPGQLTITEGVPYITTWPVASPITYGQTLAASTLTGGEATVDGNFAFVDPDFKPAAAGTITVTVVFTPDDDENPTEEHIITLVIDKKPITVTADNQSKVYGTDDPELTWTITQGALEDGDQISGALTRAAGENVGTYAITQGTLTSGANYNLDFVAGELAINPASISSGSWPTTATVSRIK